VSHRLTVRLSHHRTYRSVYGGSLFWHLSMCRRFFQLSSRERHSLLVVSDSVLLLSWRGASFEHLTTCDPSGNFHLLPASGFGPSDNCLSYYGLGWLLTANLVSTVLHTLFPHVCEISHGKTINLHPIYPHHLQCCVRVIFGLRFVMQARPHSFCLIVFVFLGPELCRQLPSDSTSRWTPLLLANGWWLQTPITDLHRQVYRHAWHT